MKKRIKMTHLKPLHFVILAAIFLISACSDAEKDADNNVKETRNIARETTPPQTENNGGVQENPPATKENLLRFLNDALYIMNSEEFRDQFKRAVIAMDKTDPEKFQAEEEKWITGKFNEIASNYGFDSMHEFVEAARYYSEDEDVRRANELFNHNIYKLILRVFKDPEIYGELSPNIKDSLKQMEERIKQAQ